MSDKRRALSVLIVSTLAFTICFMVWTMFGVIGIPLKKVLNLNATQFGLLTATPVLTGALVRLPLGVWTEKFGGRVVMFLLMLASVVPIGLLGYATEYWQFLALGLLVGMAGGAAVGAPYVARWFPREQQGHAMSVYAAGSSGAALNKLVAPALLVAFGWTLVPQVYAAIMLGAVLLFWLLSASDPRHLVCSKITWRQQLLVLKEPSVRKYCQYYAIVFGGHVALCLWLVQYYAGEFAMDIRAAALLAACFSLPGGALSVMAGWLSNKLGAHAMTWWALWVSWISLLVLSLPQADTPIVASDVAQGFHAGLNVWVFTLLVFILGIAWSIGRTAVLQSICEAYPDRIGEISGAIGLAGALGGFILLILFGALMDATGIRSTAFMLLYGVVGVSLIWMHRTEARGAALAGAKADWHRPHA